MRTANMEVQLGVNKIEYNGLDQRTQKHAVVGGMTCPRCGGGVIDDSVETADIPGLEDLFFHSRFVCVKRCGWFSGGDPTYVKRKGKKK
jgi:hypothetical protein